MTSEIVEMPPESETSILPDSNIARLTIDRRKARLNGTVTR